MRLLRDLKGTVLLVLCAFLFSCSEKEKTGGSQVEEKVSADVAYERMVETEEVIAELVMPINRLKRSVHNLNLAWDAKLFTPEASVLDLKSAQISATNEVRRRARA